MSLACSIDRGSQNQDLTWDWKQKYGL